MLWKVKPLPLIKGKGVKEVTSAEKANSAINPYSTKRGDRNVSPTSNEGL